MAKPDYVIEAKNLQKAYGDNVVLKGIDLSVERGTMLALLGPNGAGKTTTVRILSTLLHFDGGSVMIEGHDVATDPDAVRQVIGLTGQSAAVDELLTGRENLIMMGRLYRLTKQSAKARAQELLEEFDLIKAADRPLKTYSGGMRRRLDLAVSLIATPPIIFLDEPTTGLDPRSRIAMWDIINRLKENGATILLTTQYLEEADQLADRIVVIDGGKVIAEGTAKELKSKVGNDRLELTFKDKAALKKATESLGEEIIADTNENDLTLTTMIQKTNTDVRDVLDTLAAANVPVESMAVHKPTLDDVFLSLTGKQAIEKEEK
ncbi:ATP-binding cassette domain-containing protein [Streptomyces caniscabiei]|uniref:ATP-binding cassette domain-containing protein n=1 Tax=Streptomyces caniscabiei TaxID=2746961 RepID=UPI0029B24A5F|nr:ATP-binding cassette domain-containing protein [Streptomyces caniscabiei]MDX2776523.1 ATP-binding cassette domain-containing protein [Streptomyces caniscabiei]